MDFQRMTTKQIKRYWFSIKLKAYRKALESGTKQEIITTSLRVYAACGDVRGGKTAVNRVFRETKRLVPLN